MNMKKYIYLFALAGLFIGVSSCNDDFLDRSPLASISDANYWKSPNDLKLYVNNLYSQEALLPRYSGSNAGPSKDDANGGADTDIAIDYNRRMNGESTIPSSGGGWSSSDWSLLRNINYFMDHYKRVEAEWDEVKQYVGEVLFFRSLFYFNKMKSFGDLPWASTTVGLESDDILYAPRLSRNQVTDNIMTDLDNAINYLTARGSSGWTGRITKEAALALQARIALYEGTWEKYHALKNTPFKVAGSDGSRFIQKAADAAGVLMKMAELNGYPALVNVGEENGYGKLFNQSDYSENKEVILWRKYTVDESSNGWQRYTYAGAGRGLSKKMVDSYLCIDGKPITDNSYYKGDQTLLNVVANRDPRLSQTIFVDDKKHVVWQSPQLLFTLPTFEGDNSINTSTGYQVCKGHAGRMEEYYTNKGTTGCIYFRYAEVLLIYAEAKAELGTIEQADINKTINRLRARVGMPGLQINSITTDPQWEFATVSPLLNEIRRERKVELVCEGFRVDDIFRWAAADEVIKGNKPLGAYRAQWENRSDASAAFKNALKQLPVDENGYIAPYGKYDAMDDGYQFNLKRDYLKPLPTEELILNPHLEQNPGWN